MRTKFFILFFALCFSAFADFRITTSIVATNLTTNGSSFTYNADTRTGTNAISPTTFATNSTAGGTATNLFNQFVFAPFTGVQRVEFSGTNEIKLISKLNTAVTASLIGDWGTVSYATQAVNAAMRPISVPASNYLSQSQATNDFTQLVDDINNYSTSYLNKTTNGVNYGAAFSSPGTNTFSEQFGANAEANGSESLAVGFASNADGDQSIAIRSVSRAYRSITIGNSASSEETATNGIAIGVGASVTGQSSIAIGSGAQDASFTNSVVIGTEAQNTSDNQIMLGTSTVDVTVNHVLTVGDSYTNAAFTGTVTNRGDLSFAWTNNLDQAAGNNAATDVNRFVKVWLQGMGSSAFTTCGIAGGREGRIVTLWNTNGASWTIANQSGNDSTPANRIKTGTSADVVVTNNPGYAEFEYNATDSRWWLKNWSH